MNSLNRDGEETRELDKRIEDIVIDCVNFTDEDCEDGLVNEDGDSVIDVDWKLRFIEEKTKLISTLLEEAKAEERQRCLEAIENIKGNKNRLKPLTKISIKKWVMPFEKAIIAQEIFELAIDQAISAISNKK